MRSNSARSKTATEKTSDAASTSPIDDVLPGRLREWKETVLKQTDTNPIRTLALATGAGYLLGGGLFSPLTARLVATGVKLGLRFALLPFISQHVVSLAEGLLTEGSSTGTQDGESPFDVGDANTERSSGSKSRSQNVSTATARPTENKETHS